MKSTMFTICTKFILSYRKSLCLTWFIQFMHLVRMYFNVINCSNICICFIICNAMEKIQVGATITTKCRLQVVQNVYEKLDTNYKKKKKSSMKAASNLFLD